MDPQISSMILESLVFGIAGGMALTVAVAISLRLLPSLNAATRAAVWSLALLAQPFVPLLYLLSHVAPPSPASVPEAQSIAIGSVTTASLAVSKPAVLKSVDGRVIKPLIKTDGRWRIPLPDQLPQVLLVGYSGVVALLLIRLLTSYLRLRLLRKRTQPAPEDLASRMRNWLIRCPTLRPVELRISNQARSPLAMGFLRPVIVMPADLVLDLNENEYEDLGVHELAHLRRFDDWTNLAQRILEALLFFHPSTYYIGRKLNLEREIACDDWVVLAREGKSYARCLTKVVELRRYHRGALLLSSGAFFAKRQLIQRVELLLDKTRNAATGVSGVMVMLSVAAIVGIASQVMNLPGVIAFTQEEANATTSNRWSDDLHDLRIKLRGDVKFTDDEQSIASLSPDGFFIADEARGWPHRRLEVRANRDGGLTEKYFIDSREKPLDGVGRAWAASNYLFALRNMGLDAEDRLHRILKRKGTAGVFEEVSLIQSDHVKCEYLRLLMDQTSLPAHDLKRVSDSVRKVSSDDDKANFLIAHDRDLSAAPIRLSYFSAVNSIQSDNDRRRVLTHLLKDNGHDPETAKLVSQSAKLMNSDNDKAEVLLAIPASSSNEARCGLLSAARTIDSDDDKARVLRDSGYVESAACRDQWFAVANLIHSDNDRSNVLQGLLQKQNLEPETYRNIANSVKGMSSDNDKANVLVLLSKYFSDPPFFDSLNTINSSNDQGLVLKAVMENKPATPVMLSVIASALRLSDENEKTEILIEIAKKPKQPEIKAALQKACEKLSSDNDYRRLANVIFSDSGA